MAKKGPKATAGPPVPAEANVGEGTETSPAEGIPPPEALKIVITLKDGHGCIGIQREGCDPFLLPLPDAGLTNAIARLPEALVEASARWREQPRFPEYQRPVPPPAPPRPAVPPVTRTRRGAAPSTPTQPAPAVQAPRMF